MVAEKEVLSDAEMLELLGITPEVELEVGAEVWSSCPQCPEEFRLVSQVSETMMALTCQTCDFTELKARM